MRDSPDKFRQNQESMPLRAESQLGSKWSTEEVSVEHNNVRSVQLTAKHHDVVNSPDKTT
jgi:hypothetical protein